MKKPYYGWVVCIGCTILLFCTIGLGASAFTVYQPFMVSMAGLSNTEASAVITIRNLFTLAAMLLAKKFLEKTEIRLGVSIAVLAEAAGFVLYALAGGFTFWCAGAALVGAAYGLGTMIPVSILVNRWFIKHRALALGICAAGASCASIVCPPVITGIVAGSSLSAALMAEAAFIAGCGVVSFLILRNNPQDMGTKPLGWETAEDAKTTTPETGAARAFGNTVKRKHQVLMIAAVAFMGSIGHTGQGHLSILYAGEGIDSAHVSFLLSAFGISLTAAKLVYGFITDRIGVYRSGFVFFTLLTLGYTASSLVGVGGYACAVASAILCGFGLCVMTVGLTEFAAGISSQAEFDATVSRFQAAFMAGALIFGIVPGMLADITGTYVPAFVMFTAQCAACFAIVQYVLRKAAAPER
jgi:predicted MFS family arabinose efflux permease